MPFIELDDSYGNPKVTAWDPPQYQNFAALEPIKLPMLSLCWDEPAGVRFFAGGSQVNGQRTTFGAACFSFSIYAIKLHIDRASSSASLRLLSLWPILCFFSDSLAVNFCSIMASFKV